MSQSENFEIVCPLCGSYKRGILGTFQFGEQTLGLVRCKSCSLVYMNPRITPEVYCEYWRHYMGGIYRDSWKQLRIQKLPIILHDLRLLESYSSKGKLLDVGSGSGFFIKCAAERGWQPVGIDVSLLACDLVRQKFGLPVFCTELENASFPEGYFDTLTCFNTFPYFANPLSKAKEMNRILKANGTLLIRVPNKIPYVKLWLALSCIINKIWDRRSYSLDSSPIFLVNQLIHFSTRTILELLTKAGFQNIRLFNTPAVFYNKPSLYLFMCVLNLISTALMNIKGRHWCIAPSVTILARSA